MRMICGSISDSTVVRVPAFMLILAVLGATAGVLAPVDAHAQSVDLRYQFHEGMDLRYETKQRTSMELPGGMGSMDQLQTQVSRLEVLSVDAGGDARIRNTVESIRMEIRSPMGTQVFDSTDEDAPSDPALRSMAGMVGASSEVIVGADGQVKEIADIAATIEAMTRDFSPEERAALEETFSEDAWSSMISQSFQVLPDGPVASGESWENRMELLMPFGVLVSEQVYTLLEADDEAGVATIGLSGTIGGLEPDPDDPMAGMLDFSGGEISGTVEFDLRRGVFLSSVVHSTMEMSVQGQAMNSVTEVETRLLP